MITEGLYIQDTIRPQIFGVRDTVPQQRDTLKINDSLLNRQPADQAAALTIQSPLTIREVVAADTVYSDSLCTRNPVSDITFYDSTSFVFSLDQSVVSSFPLFFTQKMDAYAKERKYRTEKPLREGLQRENSHFETDWIFPVVLFILLLFGLVRWSSAGIFKSLVRFFSFRGINDPSSRDTTSLFYWQSTISNLGAFLCLALFVLVTMSTGSSPANSVSPFIVWIISLGIILAGVTARHGISIATGSVSGESELFREYIVSVYDGYRAAGALLLVVSLVALYVKTVPSELAINAGFVCAGVVYTVRVIRLTLIFISRHVSIVYLILYLCALEILPVLVLVKYFTV